MAQIQPLLKKHCFECHSGDEPKGEAGSTSWRQTLPMRRHARRGRRCCGESSRARCHRRKKSPGRRQRRHSARCLDYRPNDRGRARTAGRRGEGPVLRRLIAPSIRIRSAICWASTSSWPTRCRPTHRRRFRQHRRSAAHVVVPDGSVSGAADTALTPRSPIGPGRTRIDEAHLCREDSQVKQRPATCFAFNDDAVMFSSSRLELRVASGSSLPERGNYRIRISAYAVQSDEAGDVPQWTPGRCYATEESSGRLFRRAAGKPTVIEFVDHFEARDSFRILPFGTAGSEVVNAGSAPTSTKARAGDPVDRSRGTVVSTSGRRKAIGESLAICRRSAPAYQGQGRVEVVSERPAGDARRILRDFAGRAFRRAVTDEDFKPFVAAGRGETGRGLFVRAGDARRLKGDHGVAAFLFLDETAGQARRLRPGVPAVVFPVELDARRRTAARWPSRASWRKPDVLRGQVERMLDDPKAAALHRELRRPVARTAGDRRHRRRSRGSIPSSTRC